MAIPDFQKIFFPLLELAGDRQTHTVGEAVDALAGKFNLTQEERDEQLPSGNQPILNSRP